MSFWALTEELGTKDGVENWSFALSVFSKEECEKIISIGESLNVKRAMTQDENPETAPSIRKSNISWIFPAEETEWIFRKMTDLVNSANDQFFKFNLLGFAEGFQFTKYESPDGQYDQHIDKVCKKVARKLSVVVQLTDPTEYEGGDLNLYLGTEPIPMVRGVGNACIFPSYIMHQVTPVTKGTRYSLVAWVTGPQFR